MAFPSVLSVTETQFSVAGTTHNVSMPATVDAGDLLIVLIALRDPPLGAAAVIDDPAGWTNLTEASGESSATDLTLGVFVKDAAGDEGGTTVDFATSTTGDSTGAAQCYRIAASSWSGAIADVESGVAIDGVSTGGTTVQHPSLTSSWGAEDNLWLAVGGLADDDVLVSSYPTNYTNGVDTISGAGTDNGATIFSARRELSTATEDPGDTTIASSESWIGQTVAIRPAAAAAAAHLPLMLVGVG